MFAYLRKHEFDTRSEGLRHVRDMPQPCRVARVFVVERRYA
jgi:hypothetical protein